MVHFLHQSDSNLKYLQWWRRRQGGRGWRGARNKQRVWRLDSSARWHDGAGRCLFAQPQPPPSLAQQSLRKSDFRNEAKAELWLSDCIMRPMNSRWRRTSNLLCVANSFLWVCAFEKKETYTEFYFKNMRVQ